MPVEENVALMQRWFNEVWNQGRVQTIYDLMDENAIATGQDQPGVEIHGPGDFVEAIQSSPRRISGYKDHREDTFGAGDRVVVRWSALMTHTGDHLGVPATKKSSSMTGITIAQIKTARLFAVGIIGTSWL